jgi:hypothetical protein
MPVKKTQPMGTPPAGQAQLRNLLARSAWFCHGTVVCRPLRRKVRGQWVEKGPYYLWTGKHAGKTVCHALSQAQYEVTKAAIEANHQVMALLADLQAQTLQTILRKVPGVKKRK